MTRNVFIGIVVVIIFVAGGWFYLNQSTAPRTSDTTQLPPPQNTSEGTPPPTPKTTTKPNPPPAKGGGPTGGGTVSSTDIKAAIDLSSLVSVSGRVTITGTANGVSVVGVSVSDVNGYRVFTSIYPSRVIDGRWSVLASNNIPTSASSQPLLPGAYEVFIYGPNDVILTSGILRIGTITLDPLRASEIVFVAEPSVVSIGQTTKLHWRAPNTTSCRASGDWSGERYILGSEIVGPISSKKSFTLTCQGAGGPLNKTVSITPQ